MQFIQILSEQFWISLVFFTDLNLTELAVLSTLRRFEGCLEVEGWLKTGNKGHSFRAWLSLELLPIFSVVLLIRDTAECNLYQGCHHEETSDFGSENDPTLTRHCATFSPVTPIFYFTSAISVSNICTKFEKNLSDISAKLALTLRRRGFWIRKPPKLSNPSDFFSFCLGI